MYLKRLLYWIKVKEQLDQLNPRLPFVSEGEIWWASIGENIGREINGKNKTFARPVLILKKLSSDFYLVIPFTSQKHVGSWYVSYKHRGKCMFACLHQVRSIDYRRLDKRFVTIDEENMQRMQKGFQNLYLPDKR